MRNYTDEQMEWLRNNAPLHSWKETTDLFNTRFSQHRTMNCLKTHCNRHGIFPKGQLNGKPCWNYMGEGHECPTSNGYIRVRTANGYAMKGRLAVSNVPDNCQVVFRNGCTNDFSQENLMVVSKRAQRQRALLSRYEPGFKSKNPQIKAASLTWCELQIKLKEQYENGK